MYLTIFTTALTEHTVKIADATSLSKAVTRLNDEQMIIGNRRFWRLDDELIAIDAVVSITGIHAA